MFIHANYYKPYNFIKSRMKKLKVVEVLQYNGKNNKVTALTGLQSTWVYTANITIKHACSLTSILGSWIINEFENLGKRGSVLGKQKLRVTCPTGKVEFKYFSRPCWQCIHLNWSANWTSFPNLPALNQSVWSNFVSLIINIYGDIRLSEIQFGL